MRPVYLARVWAGSNVTPKLLPSRVRPVAASLKLTENCQARCVTCNYWQSRWEDKIEAERATKVIDELGAFGIRYLRFTGGEPLLRKDLFEILRRVNASRFKRITLQTNGLLVPKLHRQINESPITKVAVSVDGLEATNDHIRGIKGYYKLALQGIKLLRGKEVVITATINGLSARELGQLIDVSQSMGARFDYNLPDKNPYFLRETAVTDIWPRQEDVPTIVGVLRDKLRRPAYEMEYVEKYLRRQAPAEPPCILGFVELYLSSNGDVLSGCYVLEPVGNIFKDKLEDIVRSDSYRERCCSMVRRECPGCTCGVKLSLAANHALSFTFSSRASRAVPSSAGLRSPSGDESPAKG